MRIGLLSLVVVILCGASGAAQSIERTIDLSGLGWGRLEPPIPVDTDGNPDTEEWAVSRRVIDGGWIGTMSSLEWRVVAVRGASICAGEWFKPSDHPAAESVVVRVGRVDKLRVTIPSFFSVSPMDIVSLDTPAC